MDNGLMEESVGSVGRLVLEKDGWLVAAKTLMEAPGMNNGPLSVSVFCGEPGVREGWLVGGCQNSQ